MSPEVGEVRLLLGVDGGGSKTTALIAALDKGGQIHVLGRGGGGPSNLRLAGKKQSLASLNQAVDEALAEANTGSQKIDYAVLALAGSSSPEVQADVSGWAKKRKLAKHVEIAHDYEPVLGCGSDNGWGIALIVGTGSVAVGVNPEGHSVVKGGWGHWFGDKGSGFYLGYKALSAVAEASDEMGPETILSELVLEKLGAANPRDILKEVSAGGDTRRAVAALAPIVLAAVARQDKVATAIMEHAITEAVKLVSAVVQKLEITTPYPLALAGGVVCSSQLFRDELLRGLSQLQPPPGGITLVDEPVIGCLDIARMHVMSVSGAPASHDRDTA